MKKNLRLATVLGNSLAHLQHVTDQLVSWGFRKMEQANREQPRRSTPSKHPYVRRAATLSRTLLGFIGTAGEAYYKKYEDLKRRTNKKGG